MWESSGCRRRRARPTWRRAAAIDFRHSANHGANRTQTDDDNNDYDNTEHGTNNNHGAKCFDDACDGDSRSRKTADDSAGDNTTKDGAADRSSNTTATNDNDPAPADDDPARSAEPL